MLKDDVPFIVRFPGKVIPRIDNELLLSSPDIMPTILGLCGLEKQIPATVEGRNYAGRFTGKDSSVPLRQGALYIKNIDGEKDADGKVISYFPVSRGIKTHQYTMSLTIDRKTKELKDILLFNDLEDPYQMQNLPGRRIRESYPTYANRWFPC